MRTHTHTHACTHTHTHTHTQTITHTLSLSLSSSLSLSLSLSISKHQFQISTFLLAAEYKAFNISPIPLGQRHGQYDTHGIKTNHAKLFLGFWNIKSSETQNPQALSLGEVPCTADWKNSLTVPHDRYKSSKYIWFDTQSVHGFSFRSRWHCSRMRVFCTCPFPELFIDGHPLSTLL